MSNSINTNISAFFAQANITQASALASASVARLSSGNRIVQASDDVAALATGTSLQTQVSALKTAQGNASQGGSLLQVADGALAQIQSILQTMQSVSLQAESGSLTDTDRGFLNQEFQALSNEIDSLASGTTFNGVNLIDGSIATGGSNNPLRDASVDTSVSTVTFSGTVLNNSGGFTNASGFAITQPTADNGGNDAALYGDLSKGTFSTTVGTFGTSTQYTVTYTLNGVTYSGSLGMSAGGTTGAVAAGTTVLLSATSATSSHATIELKVGTGAIATADDSDNTGSGAITTALKAFFANATGFSANTSATVTGDTDQTGVTFGNAYNDIDKNDTAFVGDLSQGIFQVTGDSTNGYAISYALNGSTYQAFLTHAQIIAAASPTHTLTLDSGNGSITFNITGNAGTASNNTSTESASALQTALTNVFAGATAYAQHTVATTLAKDTNGVNIAGSAITATSTAGTLLDGFDGSKITVTSTGFDGVQLPPVAHFSATGSGSTTAFSVLVNGITYSTASNATVSSPTALYAAQWGSDTAGHIVLYKNGDTTSNEKIDLDMTGISHTAALITTTADVSHITDALNSAFGSGGSAGGLTFQLGTTSSSNVTVNIDSAKSTALFGGASLDISTQGGAASAATAVQHAIDTVTQIRSGVGALESQFQFASAALQTSVQNQDAARGQLLDTDIATESTAYATQQVKLQAGISVLAQANQQLQALLKLIG